MATMAEREAKKTARRARLLRSNPWLQRPRRERLGFALAAFCLFAPIGILNQLMHLPATPRPLGFVLLSLLLSGAFAAYMVFTFDRAVLVIAGSLACTLCIFSLAHWESSWRQQQSLQVESQQQKPEQIAAENAVRQYRARMNPAMLRETLLTIGMMVLGYIFFVHAFGRQMEKRNLLEAELKIARRIQESLLPPSERKTNGWHLYGAVQPASEVAGDYFDYLDLPNNRLGVLVADASGHGVSAGLMMAMLKSQLLNAAVDDPQQLLSQLNRSVRQLAPKNMFVTAAYVILYPSHEADVITVGHPPVLHYRAASRSVEEIRTANVALGFSEKLSVQSRQCKLAEGDMLLLYTDGLFEQLHSKEDEFGLQTLKMTFARHTHLAPPLACEQILAEVAAHRGSQPQNDDITLVAIQPVKV